MCIDQKFTKSLEDRQRSAAAAAKVVSAISSGQTTGRPKYLSQSGDKGTLAARLIAIGGVHSIQDYTDLLERVHASRSPGVRTFGSDHRENAGLHDEGVLLSGTGDASGSVSRKRAADVPIKTEPQLKPRGGGRGRGRAGSP